MTNGECKFYTLVRKEHKLGENKQVLGRILGYKELLCGELNKIPHGVGLTEEGHVLIAECTPEEYGAFCELTENRFPGLCKFNCSKK